MKRIVMAVTILVVCGAMMAMAAAKMGWGRTLTVNSTATIYPCPNLTYLSVYNAGTSTVYCMVNATTNQFTNTYTTFSATVPVPASQAWTFSAQDNREIESVIVATANVGATCTVYTAGY